MPTHHLLLILLNRVFFSLVFPLTTRKTPPQIDCFDTSIFRGLGNKAFFPLNYGTCEKSNVRLYILQVIWISSRDLLSWNTQTYETMSERPIKQVRQISMIWSLIRVKVMVSGTNIIRLTFLRNKLWNNGRWNVRSVTTNSQDENHAS